jgi:uncharacterized metal-binding protein
MPNGRVHSLACLVTSASAGGFVYFNKLSTPLTSCHVALGALLGILISPDLDLMETGNYSLVILRKRSDFLARLWRWFWWPYARLSRHRGISHWPIIGTLLRFVYCIVPAIIVTAILNLYLLEVRLNLDVLLPYLIGLMLSDFVHTTLDVVF